MARIIFQRRRKTWKSYVFPLALLGLLVWSSWWCGSRVWAVYKDYAGRERKYDDIIRAAAGRHCVDSRLLKAVIWKESSFNPDARGGSGEIGLMQIMRGKAVRDWADGFHVALPSPGNLFDPELNVEIGAWYLSRAMRKWQDYKQGLALALCEYNAGPARAAAWKPESYDGDVLDRIKISSTKAYVQSILEKYADYCARDARPGESPGRTGSERGAAAR
jgi:soluble lytic murein transglycosylase